jgi:predicted metalloprotease with PDZ domain
MMIRGLKKVDVDPRHGAGVRGDNKNGLKPNGGGQEAATEDVMKRAFGVLAAVMVMVMTVPAMAGDANKCSASTQDCLNHMATNLKDRGWVGIEMDDSGGMGKMTITKVVDNSPALKAGFEVGDTLVAVNGVAFSEDNKKELKKMQYSMKPGADFTYTVARNGSKVDLDVELGTLPDNVMAQWIGGHMMDHAELQMASAE